MTAPKSLPARPSLESLRKQAKQLARATEAGEGEALTRVRAHLPHAPLPLTQRNAQLVIAREYGFAGWQDLTAEVRKRLGEGLEWAAERARRLIHDNDVEGLKGLLAEYPALLSWRSEDEDGGLVGTATGAYGDAGDAQREAWFTRRACAELLIDAGAIVPPSVFEGVLHSRAKGLLELFRQKGLLPQTLEFLAAVGEPAPVRAALDATDHDDATLHRAFVCACRFGREEAASILLERITALDPELGRRIDASIGRRGFITHFIEHGRSEPDRAGLWTAFVKHRVSRAAHDGDLQAFVAGLESEPTLLGEDRVDFQAELIEAATLNDRGAIIAALLDRDPAILRREPPPPSLAIEIAFTYAKTHLLPLLTRIWTVPDDLPHAAGLGDLSRVKGWFAPDGTPALGDPAEHAPATSVHPREPQWDPVGVQQVLDTALAWAVINRQFEVADFLLDHGADINTNWNSHEPASILHHLVFQPEPYDSMRFLIDRGIDMTIEDYRWRSTAYGWALHGKNDPALAEWMKNAERERDRRR